MEMQCPDNVRHDWQLPEVVELFTQPFSDLVYQAQAALRRHFDANAIQLSTLLNVKAGGCPEDCAYCPQSARYDTGLDAGKLLDVSSVALAAENAREAGATRFCMGAAWRELRDRDLPKIQTLIMAVKQTGMEACVTLGMLSEPQAHALKRAGLDYYNHNLDTSEEYYPEIISTRTYAERLQTLEYVRRAGINVCCGGIIGMGERLVDRAALLRNLANQEKHPESVPINLLIRVKGTPLAHCEAVDPFDFIKTIAVARLLMPASYIRLSAGRTMMSDETQALCFLAGANSIFYGDKLLTTENPRYAADRNLFQRLGLHAG